MTQDQTELQDRLGPPPPEPAHPAELPIPPGTAGWPLPGAASGWAVPEPRPPRRPMLAPIRWLMIGLSLAAMGLLALFLWRLRIVGGDSDAYAWGRVLGSVAIAFAISLVLRWIYVRRQDASPRLASPWVLLSATLVLGLQVMTTSAAVPPPTALPDPEAWFSGASPYELVMPDPSEAAAFTESPAGSLAVRLVYEGETLIGYVLVTVGRGMDAAEALSGFASGVSNGSSEGERLTIAGRSAVLVSTGSSTAIAFVDDSTYLVAVFGADATTTRTITDALIARHP